MMLRHNSSFSYVKGNNKMVICMKKLDRNNKFGDFFLSETKPSILQRMLFCLSYSQSLHRIEPLFFVEKPQSSRLIAIVEVWRKFTVVWC